MAKDDFSVVLQGEGSVVAAPVYNPGPSPLDPVLNTISSGIRQFAQDMDERAKRKKEKKKEEEEAREKEGKGYLFDALTGVNRQGEFQQSPWMGVVRNTTPTLAPTTSAAADAGASIDASTAIIEGAVSSGTVSQERLGELEQETAAEAEGLTLIDTAISQGTMPRQAKPAAVDRILQDFRAKFPDVDVEVILSMMDKMGIKTALSYNIQRDMKDIESGDEGRREYISNARTRGMEIMGPAAATLTDEQLISTGAVEIQRDAEMKRITESLEIATKQANLTEKQLNMEEERAAQDIARLTTQSALSTFAPLVNEGRRLIDMMLQNPGGNPAVEEQFRETMGLLKSRVPVLIENYVNQALQAGGSIEQANAIRETLTTTLQRTLIEPLENRDSDFLKMAKTLETNLGLKTQEAFPLISMMKSMGINVQLADLVMANADPETQERLAAELKGITSSDIYSLRGRETAGTQLLTMVRVLQGETTLNQLDMSPQQLARTFRTVDKTTQSLGRQIATGDLSQGDAYLNGMAEVAIAAEQLGRGSSVLTLGNAIASLTNGGAAANLRKLMANGEDPEKAQLVGVGARAAVARAMEALKTKPKTVGFYSVVYDPQSGKWSTKFNETAWRNSPASRSGVGDPMDSKLGINRGGTSRTRPPVPAEARALATSLNNASNFLVDTADLDEGAPKASKRELREWYNQGKLPPSVRKELEQKRENSRKGPLEALNAFEEVLQEGDFDLKVPTTPGPGGAEIDATGNVVVSGSGGRKVTIETVDTVRARHGNKPLFRQTQQAAQKYGVPEEVALVLAGHEGKFNPNARANAGKGRTAWGPMQIVDTIHNKETMRLYGKKVRDLSPQQNIDYGMRLLAENYKATGNWQDAMSMYHSGVTLSEATRQNRSDGNIRTADYISGLAAAAGLT